MMKWSLKKIIIIIITIDIFVPIFYVLMFAFIMYFICKPAKYKLPYSEICICRF